MGVARLLVAMATGQAQTQRAWARISRACRTELDEHIAISTCMRDRLDGCIGRGCLSLRKRALYDPQDRAARRGPGPRDLLGEP